MPKLKPDLGALVSVHGTSPVYLQRAAIVAILSFFFFMATLLIFYIQQQLMYFVMSTAFLVIYIFTMIGWVLQRRNMVSIYENGIAYKKFASTWDDIKSVKADARSGIAIIKNSGESITIGSSVAGIDKIALELQRRLSI